MESTDVHRDTLKPYVGKEFVSEEDAYRHYNAYARSKGFSIIKSSYNRSRKTSCVTSRIMVCSKQEEKDLNDNRRNIENVRKC